MVGAFKTGPANHYQQQRLNDQVKQTLSGPPSGLSSHAGHTPEKKKEKQSFQKPPMSKSESSGTAPRTKNMSCARKDQTQKDKAFRNAAAMWLSPFAVHLILSQHC